MKRKVFVLLGIFLLAVVVPVLASARQAVSEPEYHFVVWLHDGGRVSFPLEEHPVVTHSNGILAVSSGDAAVEYAHASVRKFTIEEVEEVPDEPTPGPEPTPDPATELYFVAWLRDGSRISFPFSEHPRLTYSAGDIVITTAWDELRYAHADVRKFTLSDEDLSQGETTEIAPTERESQWQRQGDVMVFSDCTPGSRVAVFDASGRLIQQYAIASDGTLHIPLSSFASGMYVVKIESIAYKFMKR